MATIDKRTLRAFVRLDGSGRTVPSSLIMRKNKPKVGRWVEIPAWECCNTTTSTTTGSILCATYEIVFERGTIILRYMDCDGTPRGPFEMTGPIDDTFCCLVGSINLQGEAEIFLLDYGCSTTTTTTTTSSTSTTTTTTSSTSTTTTTKSPTTTTTTTTLH